MGKSVNLTLEQQSTLIGMLELAQVALTEALTIADSLYLHEQLSLCADLREWLIKHMCDAALAEQQS